MNTTKKIKLVVLTIVAFWGCAISAWPKIIFSKQPGSSSNVKIACFGVDLVKKDREVQTFATLIKKVPPVFAVMTNVKLGNKALKNLIPEDQFAGYTLYADEQIRTLEIDCSNRHFLGKYKSFTLFQKLKPGMVPGEYGVEVDLGYGFFVPSLKKICTYGALCGAAAYGLNWFINR